VLDSDHDTECRDCRRPRPDANILDPDCYDLWLDPGMQNVAAASKLLRPFDARLMRCYSVSTRINHVVNEDEECSAPVELAQVQNRLF
jgi:putative SOS response-associated peptidase YedK